MLDKAVAAVKADKAKAIDSFLAGTEDSKTATFIRSASTSPMASPKQPHHQCGARMSEP